MAPNLVEKITDALGIPSSPKHKKTKFDQAKVTVVFVLGGPGAGASFPIFRQPTRHMKTCRVRERNTMQPPCREVQLCASLRWRPPARRTGPPKLSVWRPYSKAHP